MPAARGRLRARITAVSYTHLDVYKRQVLIMALGLESASETPFLRIINSVKLTTYINFFILPGFILGLLLVNRWYHVRTQTWGFLLCAAGLAVLYAAYMLRLPVWIAVVGFMAFELFLNAGPHLMTFILPPQIYSVAERGAGAVSYTHLCRGSGPTPRPGWRR